MSFSNFWNQYQYRLFLQRLKLDREMRLKFDGTVLSISEKKMRGVTL